MSSKGWISQGSFDLFWSEQPTLTQMKFDDAMIIFWRGLHVNVWQEGLFREAPLAPDTSLVTGTQIMARRRSNLVIVDSDNSTLVMHTVPERTGGGFMKIHVIISKDVFK